MALPALTLVGPGRAGRALARSWLAAGGTIDTILARTIESARGAGDVLGGGTPGVIGASPAESPVVAIAVPDDAVAAVAAALASSIRCRLAFHLSGALGSEEIGALLPRAGRIASLHPLRPFRGDADESWKDAFVAVEGDDEAVSLAEQITRDLGASPHRIAAGAKALYHSGATLAAGGSVALLSFAVRAWTSAGLPESEARAALAGLTEEAASGAGQRPFESALTGPVARRDVGTIRAHLRALDPHPELRLLYVLLARETLARTPGRGREEELRALLAC